jgi:hypothetical protein
MKNITLSIALILSLTGCYKQNKDNTTIQTTNKTVIDYSQVDDYNSVVINTVKHNGKDYVVAKYRDGVCIIPEIK